MVIVVIVGSCQNILLLWPSHIFFSKEGKLQEIKEVGESVELLQNHGILLDAESFREQEKTQSQQKTR